MTYNIITIGCQTNRSDSERLSFYLEKLGFLRVDNFSKANLVVFVTCGVKQMAEDRVYGLVNRVYKNNKKAIVGITGCLSDRPDVQIRLKGKADFFFNISNLAKLNEKLKKFFPKIKKSFFDNVKNYLEISSNRSSSFSAFVPIGNGCNNFCSYCVVPYARGREVYRSASDIVEEVRNLVQNGYKEIILLAQNVNSYKSNRVDFPDLLEKIDKIPGDFWLRFSSSHPKDVSPKLIKVLKSSRHLCEHFHLAVQSGDNDILEMMNRKYRVEDFKKTVKKIKQALDYKNGLPASITTDIIVGFPGETQKNFSNTLKLLREMKFGLIYIAKYSPRYGTVSAQMRDNISLEEKKKREVRLNNLLRKIALENNKFYLNKEVEVLIEGVSRKGIVFGKTRTDKIVKIYLAIPVLNKKSSRMDLNNMDRCGLGGLIGQFAKVKINKAKEFELEGNLVFDDKNKKDNKYIKNKGNKKIVNSKNIKRIVAKKEETKKEKERVLVILGPTSSGKTSVAVKLAQELGGEIVSADSRQVYKGMDIGTGKDLAEYNSSRGNIPYHLIDVCSPKTVFSVAKYQKLAFKAIDDILKRKKLPILVGGSGLYLEAVISNYTLAKDKPVFGQRDAYENLKLEDLQNEIKNINPSFFKGLNISNLKNKRRLARYLELLINDKNFSQQKGEARYDFLIFGLEVDREILRKRIYDRLVKRLDEEDLIGEVERLKKEGVSFKRLESFGLEYRAVSLLLQKKISYQKMLDNLYISICQFSKRQKSWFRRMEKQGIKINWVKKINEIKNFF
ncbi:MAG: tRNA (adenosine(37)-N6)-dimethylallyltransferase MiaA [Patescibacteria group bacterium]|jgi:tRNA-2-methylthio-N6-dimethylallyladenosine synthase